MIQLAVYTVLVAVVTLLGHAVYSGAYAVRASHQLRRGTVAHQCEDPANCPADFVINEIRHNHRHLCIEVASYAAALLFGLAVVAVGLIHLAR